METGETMQPAYWPKNALGASGNTKRFFAGRALSVEVPMYELEWGDRLRLVT